MHKIGHPLWRQAALITLLLGVDLAMSLPIMGTAYRPFDWLSISSANAGTLYPVIQNLSFVDGKPSLSITNLAQGTGYALQRTTSLLDASWTNIVETTATEPVVVLTDTNSLNPTAFYRVKQSP